MLHAVCFAIQTIIIMNEAGHYNSFGNLLKRHAESDTYSKYEKRSTAGAGIDMSRLNRSEQITHIKMERQRYNAAISERNVDDICAFFTPDYHVVTARGVQSHGIEEQHKRWTAVFAEDPIVVYRRNTKDIHLNEHSGAAEERGYWAGKYLLNQKVTLAVGVYSAKWLKQPNGSWLVQAEIFTMLRSTLLP